MSSARIFGLSIRATDPARAYRIVGVVDEFGVPGAYPVSLYDRESGNLLMKTESKSTGAYGFHRLEMKPAGFFLVAHDTGIDPVNAAIADLLTPEPMPT